MKQSKTLEDPFMRRVFNLCKIKTKHASYWDYYHLNDKEIWGEKMERWEMPGLSKPRQ